MGSTRPAFDLTPIAQGTTPAQDWMHFPDMIREFTDRLAGVVIENREGIEVIEQHDCGDALHYVDPHTRTRPETCNAATLPMHARCRMTGIAGLRDASLSEGRVLVSGLSL